MCNVCPESSGIQTSIPKVMYLESPMQVCSCSEVVYTGTHTTVSEYSSACANFDAYVSSNPSVSCVNNLDYWLLHSGMAASDTMEIVQTELNIEQSVLVLGTPPIASCSRGVTTTTPVGDCLVTDGDFPVTSVFLDTNQVYDAFNYSTDEGLYYGIGCLRVKLVAQLAVAEFNFYRIESNSGTRPEIPWTTFSSQNNVRAAMDDAHTLLSRITCDNYISMADKYPLPSETMACSYDATSTPGYWCDGTIATYKQRILSALNTISLWNNGYYGASGFQKTCYFSTGGGGGGSPAPRPTCPVACSNPNACNYVGCRLICRKCMIHT